MKHSVWLPLALVACGGIESGIDAGPDASSEKDAAPDAPACTMPEAGTCAIDSDCVIAVCADWGCQCFGGAVAKSQLGGCLVEKGSAAPASCKPVGPVCDCPALPIPQAECIEGVCTAVLPDGG